MINIEMYKRINDLFLIKFDDVFSHKFENSSFYYMNISLLKFKKNYYFDNLLMFDQEICEKYSKNRY